MNTIIPSYFTLLNGKVSIYTHSFLVPNHIFQNGVKGITKEAGGFANKVPADSRKWNSVSIFLRIPRLVQHRSLIAQMISLSALRDENRETHTHTYIYISEQKCAIGSGNGFLPLRRTSFFISPTLEDSLRVTPRLSFSLLIHDVCQEPRVYATNKVSCRWEISTGWSGY